MKPNTYLRDALQPEIDRLKDKNCCAPVAVSLVTETPYTLGYTACRSRGRPHGKGLDYYGVLGAVHDLGYSCEEHQVKQANGSKYTMKTILQRIPKGKWLVFVNRHVVAVVDGTIQDWTQGRKYHVLGIVEVTKNSC